MDINQFNDKNIDEIHIKEFIENAQLKPTDGPVNIHAISLPVAFRGTVEYMGKKRQYILEGFGNYLFLEGISGMFACGDKDKIVSVIEAVLKE